MRESELLNRFKAGEFVVINNDIMINFLRVEIGLDMGLCLSQFLIFDRGRVTGIHGGINGRCAPIVDWNLFIETVRSDLMEIQVGDTVRVKNTGGNYSSYWGFFKEHGLGDVLLDNIYIYNSSPFNDGDECEVVAIGEHRNKKDSILVLALPNFKKINSRIGLMEASCVEKVVNEVSLSTQGKIITVPKQIADELIEKYGDDK